MNLVFLMEQNIFLLEYFKIIFSETTQIDSWKCNGISEGNTENITKSDSNNFSPTFADHHVLPNISFNVYCLKK